MKSDQAFNDAMDGAQFIINTKDSEIERLKAKNAEHEPGFCETKTMIGITDSLRREIEELKTENSRLSEIVRRMRNDLIIIQRAGELYGAYAAAANAKSMEFCIARATVLVYEEYGIKPGVPTTQDSRRTNPL